MRLLPLNSKTLLLYLQEAAPPTASFSIRGGLPTDLTDDELCFSASVYAMHSQSRCLPPCLPAGPESSRLAAAAASPGSAGASVTLPSCLPDDPEDPGSSLPEPGLPPLPSLLVPALPLFVPLHSDWNTALVDWGLAWEAHIYGTGFLFVLLTLLSLLGLLSLPCRGPAGCKLLSLLHTLLLGAGTTRATLLFGDACRKLELLPDLAVRLLHDLALPCLASALAVTLWLLSLRCRAKKCHRGLRHPCLLAVLVLLHFLVATGAILAADLLPQFQFLLLASRAVFAILAALLSSAVLLFYCLARVGTAQTGEPKDTVLPGRQCPFANAHQWSRAAGMALLAAFFGALGAALQAYAIFHALGYGLSAELFGPWPWWALQLACRLCEAGMGLPLACMGLYPLTGCHCCGRLCCLSPDRAVAKNQVRTNSVQWPLSPNKKLKTTRRTLDHLPLYPVPAKGPKSGSLLSLATTDANNDSTADFCPPSPINLRRSIGEALCGEGLFRECGALYASSTLLLSLAREQTPERGLCHLISCMELVPAVFRDDGDASLASSGGPNMTTASSQLWRGSSCCRSPYKSSFDEDSCSLERGSSLAPMDSRSPPWSPTPPGPHQYWALATVSQEPLGLVGMQQEPGADTVLLQEEFMDVCRQLDALSTGSDTIDL